MDISPSHPVERAAEAVGGRAKLAGLLGVSQQMVHFWVTGKRRVTAERASRIEQATGGAVKRHELRPDLFDATKPEEAAA